MDIILASASPRRRELLASVGLTLQIEAADVDESALPGEDPEFYVRRLAESKAATVAKRYGNTRYVLAADTTVSVHGRIFGKPADPDEARRMLRALAGGEHKVSTGFAFCLPGGKLVSEVVRTTVTMRPLSGDEIDWYIATGEPFDKAGGYAIQGRAAHFVTRINGSVTNVIGLPLSEVVLMLRAFGFPVALKGQGV